MQELQIISDYLYENNYISSYDDAEDFISVMSNDWIEDILTESELLSERQGFRARMNRETGKWEKVPHKKTPLFDTKGGKRLTNWEMKQKVSPPRDTARIEKTESGGRVGKRRSQGPGEQEPTKFIAFEPYMGRSRQGRNIKSSPPEHHTGIYSDYKPQPHGTGGRLRGVRIPKGSRKKTIEKSPLGKSQVVIRQRGGKIEVPSSTPVERFKKERLRKKEALERHTRPNKYFPTVIPKTRLDILRSKRTQNESIENFYNLVLESLIYNGYANGLNEAYEIVNEFTDSQLEDLLNYYFE